MRRKSPRVVWLPQTNANSVGAAFGNQTAVYQEFALNTAGDPGDFITGEIPLVADGDSQDILANAETSLSDVYNSGYRLRRIVGKVWVAVDQEAGATGPKSVIASAGIIVRRVDPLTALSLASQSVTNQQELLSPGEIRNTSDPWIWRRSWQVNQLVAQSASGVFAQTGVTHNYGGATGSGVDGPHVDQKTARVIGPEERLFLTCSVTNITGGFDSQGTTAVFFLTDLRILGTLRTTSGNRRNASR